jgi:hypothetical protein
MTRYIRTGIVLIGLSLSMGTFLSACVATHGIEARNGEGE